MDETDSVSGLIGPAVPLLVGDSRSLGTKPLLSTVGFLCKSMCMIPALQNIILRGAVASPGHTQQGDYLGVHQV